MKAFTRYRHQDTLDTDLFITKSKQTGAGHWKVYGWIYNRHYNIIHDSGVYVIRKEDLYKWKVAL